MWTKRQLAGADRGGDHRGRGLDDGGQFLVEGGVVRLEGPAGEGGVRALHLGEVRVVRRGRVEEVADGELLAVPQVLPEEDRALPHVDAELRDVAPLVRVTVLPGQEPVEERLVVRREPALDLAERRGDRRGGGGGGHG